MHPSGRRKAQFASRPSANAKFSQLGVRDETQSINSRMRVQGVFVSHQGLGSKHTWKLSTVPTRTAALRWEPSTRRNSSAMHAFCSL